MEHRHPHDDIHRQTRVNTVHNYLKVPALWEIGGSLCGCGKENGPSVKLKKFTDGLGMWKKTYKERKNALSRELHDNWKL